MDKISGQTHITQTQGLREQRQIARDTRIEESSSLIAAERLSPEEIGAHQAEYGRVLDDADRIKGGGIIGCLDPSIFQTFRDDMKVRDATKPHLLDNEKASEVKDEYKKAYEDAKREHAQAERTANKLGPGVHHLSNGDTVEVTQGKDGRTHVVTKTKDGNVKEVDYDPKDPNSVHIHKKGPFGQDEEITQDGTRVTRHDKNFIGDTTTTYDVDKNGNAVRERRGPGNEDYEKTTVNDDGSTDTRKLIYHDEHGRPAYEDTHQPNLLGEHQPPIHIDPRPWPPRPPIDPSPFPPTPGPFPLPGPLPFPHPPVRHPEPGPIIQPRPLIDGEPRGNE